MTFELVLQVLVAALLVVTIVYAVMLNRRLARLRDGREEMHKLIDDLGIVMARAESGIATLRKTAFEDNEALGRRITESRSARDEIGFLVDRGESLAARLEGLIGNAREAGRPSADTQPAISSTTDPDDDLFASTADAGEGPGDADARAARATATAWLRSRRRDQPAAAAGSTRALR